MTRVQGIQDFARQIHGHLMGLADEAEFGTMRECHVARVDPGIGQEVATLGLHRGKQSGDGMPVTCIEAGVVTADEVETDRCDKEPDR